MASEILRSATNKGYSVTGARVSMTPSPFGNLLAYVPP